ncbi:MAG: hypothetical protein IJA07_08885 [Agathobacter sp.]|nr:hypothetical protein [Agathobacter sp.]MBQ3559612.1 hypothetical protein [Agathobacter sp.]
MARRGLTGQLNMFDLYNSLDAGEVEMVSLVPDFEEAPEVVETLEAPEMVEAPEIVEVLEIVEAPEEDPETVREAAVVEKASQVVWEGEKVSMSRRYIRDGENIEIAYINYNKVRIIRDSEPPVVKEFASTKEAVDYYVEQMQELEKDE